MPRAASPRIHIKENYPLAPLTTLGVGGPARYYMEATDEDGVQEALEKADAGRWPLFFLGGGSNILVSDDGFPGLVVKVSLRGVYFDEKNPGVVSVAAGEDWDAFVARCVEQNLAGIECLSGIPGTAGGTPIQNVGAYGQEVSQAIVAVRVLGRADRAIRLLKAEDCRFSYRSSIFNSDAKEQYVVLGVVLALRPGGPACIRYADLQKRFGGRQAPAAISEVREAVLDIRAGKGMLIRPGDPDSRSAGSFFKNPIVSEDTARRIEEMARGKGCLGPGQMLPVFDAPGGARKLSAAWLIEKSGFARGYRRRKVGLSSKHTLAIVTRDGATAREVVDFMKEIQSGVAGAFGIDLQPEPVFVGF